jgi:hypothetical protein
VGVDFSKPALHQDEAGAVQLVRAAASNTPLVVALA